MHMPRLRALATLLASGYLVVSTQARADAEGDAKDLFTKGREQRAAGDCKSAVVSFRKAVAVYPQGLGSVRNLAECEEQLGHPAAARRAWLDVKRALTANPQRDRYDGWLHDAEIAAERLSTQVGRLTVEVVVHGQEAGSAAPTVTLGDEGRASGATGEVLPPALLATPLERDPGTYAARVVAPGAEPVERHVTLAAGESKTIHLELTLPKRRPLAGGPPPPSESRGGSALTTLGFVTLGVSAAAFVGAGVSGLVRGAALSDLESGCPGYATSPCDRSLEGTKDRGDTASTLVTVFLVTGIATAVVGTTLLVVSAVRGKSPSRTGLLATPMGWRF